MSNPVARERLNGAVACGEWLGAGPIVYGKRLAAPGVIPIGDAGAFIDPFTGSGILLALSSAEMLASAVAAQSQVVIQPEAVHAKYIDLLKESMRWRLGVAAFLRKVALSSTGRRLTVPLLAHNSGLRRFLTRATRHGGNGVVLPTKE